MDNQIEKTRCLIIGSGPAGYTAAIYASRADLRPVLYQGNQPGGQLTITTEVDNFPGYPNGVNGPEMMEDLKKQAERFGTDVRWGSIEAVDFSLRPFRCKVDDGKIIEAETVIVATGASAKWIGIPSEQEYMGAGVSGCATCDGYFYRGKVVAVVGGGDTACEEATYLSKLASKVYLIHRRNELRASKAMQNKVMNTKNIEILWDSIVDEIVGEKEGFMKSVNGIIIKNIKTNEKKKLALDGVFIAIGHRPNSEIFVGQLEMDEAGYIKTVPGTTLTNVEGVFAAGDVQDHYYRQAITAAGTGAMAAIEAERFLSSI
ncbi:MAG: Thioredoxin reductase [Bacteroidetes bacterium 38_7]|nr:MAG: Thioredoxin reductase [Bacteroidetes bacterium 38_7]HAL65356.1 thioredoxin-disulfide reductase [Bacteroidales bacterium]HPC14677.1 thioredoxin-disulfide reductase [Bacteroidales bacterium]HQQ86280.1 thioredoxin-disulfide reductase [Candidatus Neomarinimicrobiota bacterium]